MKKISKAESELRDEIVRKLNDAFLGMERAVDELNQAIGEHWSAVEDAQSVYNEALNEAQEWRDNIVTQIDEYVDERSDKWREGEKAEAYESWKSEYEAIDFSEAQLSAPDELSLDVENPAEAIEGLPDSVED